MFMMSKGERTCYSRYKSLFVNSFWKNYLIMILSFVLILDFGIKKVLLICSIKSNGELVSTIN